jgi:hypothetical protein
MVISSDLGLEVSPLAFAETRRITALRRAPRDRGHRSINHQEEHTTHTHKTKQSIDGVPPLQSYILTDRDYSSYSATVTAMLEPSIRCLMADYTLGTLPTHALDHKWTIARITGMHPNGGPMTTEKRAVAKKRAPRRRVPAATGVIAQVKKKNTARRRTEALGRVMTVIPVTIPKGKSDIEVEVMTLDPTFAQELLENTPPTQRNLRKSLVDKYASDMLAGRWRKTGAPIRLNAKLELIDGQHRCAACVKADVELLDTVIETLFDERAFEAIDQGAARSLKDVVKMAGGKPAGPPIMAGIIYESFDFKQVRLSMPERLQVVTAFQDLDTIKRIGTSKGVTSGMVAAYIRCMKKDRSAANKFFTAAFTNKPIIDDSFCDNAHLLSNWILEVKNERRVGKSGEIWKRECAYRCIQAWNAWRRGTVLKRLMFKPDAIMIDAI